ncbi:MAG: NUDIX domain-containing protein [Oliverpabstia sp.]
MDILFKNDDYAIISGHVASMETSVETLKREFEEELHTKIEVDNLLAIGEIYFPWGKKPCHQICLYYNVHLVDNKMLPEVKHPLDWGLSIARELVRRMNGEIGAKIEKE